MGKAKLNIPMCAALVLLLLTMISIHLTSGLYARYTATATATSSARVAKFAVSGSLSDENILTVTNDSEVTIRYSVNIVFTENVPPVEKLKVTLNGIESTLDKDGTTRTFNMGTLPAETASEGLPLVFTVLDWSFVTEHAENTPSISKNFPFTVNIIAEQVD